MAIKRIGYGQVEPNHLSAQRNGQVYAQLPCASTIKVLENGQFVKYDYAKNEINYTGEGEWMLVYNEVKLYEARQTRKDFALKAENCDNGIMVPRVFKTMIGDIFTTNCIAGWDTASAADLAVEDELVIRNGYLTKDTATDGEMVWQVVKVYTMPDGQEGVKVMRIK